ncbi:hypothetical protein Ahy_A09g041413 [Arachis hypogaea]|uniref:Uncharacterized protein n=1 Tax=Arachis hypogaea TaxID=3818 RepID=A0A445BCQ1_ARAHY|nr:hypothetical protein Ahy_A09g041413 [Arachis hypogaea]
MGCGSSTLGRDSRPLGRDNSENGGGQDAKNLRVKLVLLGDSGVGKSCIVLRFVRGQFDPTSKVTVGASFLSQTIALQDSTTVKFEIWDTAGQERYAALAPYIIVVQRLQLLSMILQARNLSAKHNTGLRSYKSTEALK